MSSALNGGGKRHVVYYHNPEVGNYHYGPKHPMKPHRLALTHSLVMEYGLLDKMDVFIPKKATYEELTQFHTPEYLDWLMGIIHEMPGARPDFSIEDCPRFPSVYEFCQLYAGGSIEGAWKLNQKRTDVAINWAGGLHHARKSEGSGFCYINDAVLAIIEMLRYHPRILYIDIDIHHGDGVQDAFYHTDRVMCVSFHKYGNNFFPGTGNISEIGYKEGKYYSVNVPLKEGIDDQNYLRLFKPIISDVMEFYRPTAVVLQCGADSLKGDRIGNFNLSINGHSECVKFVASYNLPTLVVGGGGYCIRNVSRCWTNETAVLLDVDLPFDLPDNEYFSHFAPDFKLQNTGLEVENLNSRAYLDTLLTQARKNIRTLQHSPSVQMTSIPPSLYDELMDNDDEDEEDKDANADYLREIRPDMDRSPGRPRPNPFDEMELSNDREESNDAPLRSPTSSHMDDENSNQMPLDRAGGDDDDDDENLRRDSQSSSAPPSTFRRPDFDPDTIC